MLSWTVHDLDMHAAGQAAEQLVGDGAGVGRDGLDRQPLAPQGDRRADCASGWPARSIATMSMETRPTSAAGVPSTSTGVPEPAWRG